VKQILVLGAGMSASYLIKYLLDEAPRKLWVVTVADASEALAQSKCNGHSHSRPIAFDIEHKEQREAEIRKADLVISLLPPTLHIKAASDCVRLGKHLITASYISPQMAKLHKRALKADVLLLNECGLDPGIDHLSAMKMMDDLRNQGAVINGFRSYCGGLVAPEFDNNPWHYKFTWNPKNVVLAGQSAAKFKQGGIYKYVPPTRIFAEFETLNLGKYGTYDAYLNRDSLGYIKPYGLETADTVLRGTLRGVGYCEAWDVIATLGLTDDTYMVEHEENLSWKLFTESFLPAGVSLLDFVKTSSGKGDYKEIYKKLEWLGLMSDRLLPELKGSPAQLLQHLLMEQWKLGEADLDMIIMHHIIDYSLHGKRKQLTSTLQVKGESKIYTAMAKTVGLPMGIAASLLLDGKIKARGVHIPLTAEFYEPMLIELAKFGINFDELETV
jgi:saccharopine dehydrogenase-like NADP-dependent oxidoreductase